MRRSLALLLLSTLAASPALAQSTGDQDTTQRPDRPQRHHQSPLGLLVDKAETLGLDAATVETLQAMQEEERLALSGTDQILRAAHQSGDEAAIRRAHESVRAVHEASVQEALQLMTAEQQAVAQMLLKTGRERHQQGRRGPPPRP